MDRKNVIINLDLKNQDDVLDYLSKKACELDIAIDACLLYTSDAADE